MQKHLWVLMTVVMLLALVPVASQADDDTFFTDFTEYTDGQQPSDWTERWNPAHQSAVVDNDTLVVSRGTNAFRYALSWDAVGEPDGDVEIAYRFKMTTPLVNWGGGGGVVRGDHTNPALIWTGLTGYTGGQQATTSTVSYWSIGAQNTSHANSVTMLSMAATPTVIQAGTWYVYRMRIVGNQIEQMVYADGSTPPGWMGTATLTSPLGAGWVGLWRGAGLGDLVIDWYAVRLNGEPAPIPE